MFATSEATKIPYLFYFKTSIFTKPKRVSCEIASRVIVCLENIRSDGHALAPDRDKAGLQDIVEAPETFFEIVSLILPPVSP